MRNLCLILALLGASLSPLHAQKFCKKTVVYFDSGKSNLNQKAQTTLQQFLTAQSGDKFLVELMGHTDANDDESANLRLSEARVNQVEKHLRSLHPNLEFKTAFYGESQPVSSNESDAERALNRRVEVFLIPMRGDRLTFTGDRAETLEVPMQFFGDCPICDSKPTITTYLTAEEADRGGLSLISTEGNPMITAGMTTLDYDCGSKADNCTEMTIRIPSAEYDPAMKHWAYNPTSDRWELGTTPVTYVDGFYEMKLPSACPGVFDNFDKVEIYRSCGTYFVPAEGLTSMVHQRHHADTLLEPAGTFRKPASLSCTPFRFQDLARKKRVWYYAEADISSKLDSITYDTLIGRSAVEYKTMQYATLTLADYQQIPTSDTTVILKVKGKPTGRAGFKLDTIPYVVPMRKVGKKKYEAPYFNLSHQLQIGPAKQKKWFRYADLKVKYKAKGKQLKVKVRKKDLYPKI